MSDENKNEIENDLDADQAVRKLTQKIEKELKKYQKQFRSDWRDFENAYYGKQHKTGDSVKQTKNHIFRIIETQVPVITDSMPSTLFTATRDDKQLGADMLSKGVQFVYKNQKLQTKLATEVRKALTAAPGFLYVEYDYEANKGLGDIIIKPMHWESVLLDGNKQTLEESSRAVLFFDERRDFLKRKFPHKAKEIQEAKGNNNDTDDRDEDDLESEDFDRGDSGPIGKPSRHKNDDILKLKETWIQDFSLESIPAEDTQADLEKEYQDVASGNAPEIRRWEDHKAHLQAHNAQRVELLAQVGLPDTATFEEAQATVEQLIQQNPAMQEDLTQGLLALKILDNHLVEHEELSKLNPTGQQPKYKDGWRVIQEIGKVIVYDGPNKVQSGQIPLVPIYCYKDDTIYGFGEVKNILSAQRSLNQMDYYEYIGLRLNSNSGWIIDSESGIDPKQLTNDPGIVITKKQGTEVRRAEPGQVSPQLSNRREVDKQTMDSIVGQNEETMNGAISGNPSGVTVQRLQSQTIGRYRLKNRLLDYYTMERLASIVAKFILHYWSEEKTLRFRDEFEEITEYVYNPLEVEDLEYTIEISPSTMAGVDKDALNAFYHQMMISGQITLEEYLQVAELPKKERLLKLVRERNAQNNETQQVQAQLEQSNQQIMDMQKMIIALKAAIDSNRVTEVEMLTSEEKKLFDNELKNAAAKNLVNEFATQQVEQQVQTQGAVTNDQAPLA